MFFKEGKVKVLNGFFREKSWSHLFGISVPFKNLEKKDY